MADKFELITADGTTFNLNGTFATGGYSAGQTLPRNVGLPPVKHVTQDIYGMPGSYLQQINVRPRIIDLPLAAWGDNYDDMIDARARLINVLRWDRDDGSPPDPATLRITVDGVSADLSVHYLSDVTTENRSAPHRLTTMGIRLIAYDPFWRATSTTVTELVTSVSATAKWITMLDNISFEIIPDGTPASGGASVTCVAKHPLTGYVYIGGNFDTLDGVAGIDKVALWDGTDYGLVGAGSSLSSVVYALAFAPNGVLYAAGNFVNAGDADGDYFAQYDGIAWSSVGGPAQSTVYTVLVARDGTVYIGGDFTDMDSVANTAYIAKWDGSTWTAMGTGAVDRVRIIVEGPDGSIYAGGNFNSMGGVANTACIAKWNGTAWSAVGDEFAAADEIRGMAFDDAGNLYVIGDFTTRGNIEMWNGAEWSELGTGLNAAGGTLAWLNGVLYAGGLFTSAGDVAVADMCARWDGTRWFPLPVDLPTPVYIWVIAVDDDYIYIGSQCNGTGIFAGGTDVAYAGSVQSFPTVTVLGEGTLVSIANEDTGKEMLFDMFIAGGEIITIDLTPGTKTVTSNFYGNKLGDVLPQSDLNTFALAPDPLLDTDGYNHIGITMSGLAVTEQGDDNNQVTVVPAQITGLSLVNTDQGRLYVSIVDDGGGDFHVNIYSDLARTALVAHTASYAAGGDEALVADNTSGLGGTITIDAATAADVNIVIMPPFCQFEYYNKFWSLEDAVK